MPDVAEVVDGGGQADGLGDRRRARLEAGRGRRPAGSESSFTSRIMPPPPRNGGMASSSSRPGPQHADAGRPHHLVGGEGEEVDAEVVTSTGACGTSWAPSATTTAPAAWAASAISLTGLMVPSTLDMAETPDQLARRRPAGRGRRGRGGRRRRSGCSAARDPDLLGQDQPRHDVGVVLHLGEERRRRPPAGWPGPRCGPPG